MRNTRIKVGSVSLPLHQHAKGWRFTYKDRLGRWKYVTHRRKDKAIEEAREKARELHNGSVEIGALPPDRAELVRRFLELDITHAELDAWLESRKRQAISVPAAVAEFLEAKKLNRGLSFRNVRTLSGDLNNLSDHLGDANMASVTVSALEGWLATYNGVSPRRRKNLRGSSVTFFRWARKRGYLPDATTAAEKLDSPIVSRKIPETWSADEMTNFLRACTREYLPWLVLAGFAGVRQEELIIDPRSTKSPLDWSDFHWGRKIIIVRPETSKVGERRIVPILPVVRAWLYRMRKKAGPVCPSDPPYKARDAKRPSLTSILGESVGGWRNNALRHSFISYRAAVVGLAQTAMEAGNSEAEARRSYNAAKGKDEAAEWFGLVPKKVLKSKSVRTFQNSRKGR